jgi:hypothetical protein
MMRPAGLLALAVLLLVGLTVPVGVAAPAGAHNLPTAGDQFHYFETVVLNNGNGNYTGYAENSFINGSISVSAVATNGTAAATYQSSDHWEDNQGDSQLSSESGAFTFSGTTFRYVNGTDNQTGDNGTPVWFYMNDSAPIGSSLYLLTTQFNVVSTSAPFPISSSSTGYVKTILVEGNGTFQRNDGYGEFQASYNWKSYFDPATGYIVGYVYTEQDSDSNGDGFTWTDSLAVTSTSYALTPAAAPPPPPAPASSVPWALIGVAVIVVIVLVLVIVLATRRRGASIPRHSVEGATNFGPSYSAPTPLNFGVPSQPSVQQIVLKETVKVNCQYCGTLIDSTATVCPKCGAPRT